ncbi:N-acetylmuramic acid 6-phosphate etherase 2 [Companilactobacillus crustorum]|uniref:N-acetylmuramic acid 6-phosphate etherase n=3 Tax=Companilactobacillus TaxID=2767879 RepID=A0A837RL92_9LACO|nr:N-acetylmuramic acid 6-phosphate etherase [Companilactobacillus crustorum]HCD07961.1 N-acetylmuramic acid 6-phosphate etherase [Lactobacillus sp.]APU71409.1 N-acetylmuramic acid 6-phosphate etherase 2 [Companilactobacillus crustorum]KRK43817.1 N-acetylmuramic acid-6-phosphate etherase [Companilactobacillus crustorum JCM 15951]KRO21126.1 N-acetylmuramic acid-6-phosphate etherase [Companilactobacillus crustorum]WDT66563.1 N-acetylmuramic acid 6-phosphate etherase [Companilactobacillus crustor
MDLTKLSTETRNSKSMLLDTMSVAEILKLMNSEDQTVPQAINKQLPQVEAAVNKIIQQFKKNGRLIYLGAGTSGRLGVLDAAECVPTFGTDPSMVQGLIAGGQSAMTVAVEGAEDSLSLAEEDLKKLKLNANDAVVGLAASGRTPYVIGALKYAHQVGAVTVSIACNQNAEISKYVDYPIEVVTGPEVLTGSTRLKAGTAQKLILNMISTTSMIKLGKAYQNLMIDVKPTNDKLVERSKRIIMQATDCDYQTAEKNFIAADEDVKVAIIMTLTGVDKTEAIKNLQKNNGFVRKAMKED